MHSRTVFCSTVAKMFSKMAKFSGSLKVSTIAVIRSLKEVTRLGIVTVHVLCRSICDWVQNWIGRFLRADQGINPLLKRSVYPIYSRQRDSQVWSSFLCLFWLRICCVQIYYSLKFFILMPKWMAMTEVADEGLHVILIQISFMIRQILIVTVPLSMYSYLYVVLSLLFRIFKVPCTCTKKSCSLQGSNSICTLTCCCRARDGQYQQCLKDDFVDVLINFV